jgi:hypothetical protein
MGKGATSSVLTEPSYVHGEYEAGALAGDALHPLSCSEIDTLLVILVGHPTDFERHRHIHNALAVPPQQALQQQAPFLLAWVDYKRTWSHVRTRSFRTDETRLTYRLQELALSWCAISC